MVTLPVLSFRMEYFFSYRDEMLSAHEHRNCKATHLALIDNLLNHASRVRDVVGSTADGLVLDFVALLFDSIPSETAQNALTTLHAL